MNQNDERELEQAVHRLLTGLGPVPAPPGLLPKVLAALPRTSAPRVHGWAAWPWTLRAAVFVGLTILATVAGWAGTIWLWQPGWQKLQGVVTPTLAFCKAMITAFDVVASYCFRSDSLFGLLARASVFSALGIAGVLAAGCVRLLQFATNPSNRGENP